MFGVPFLFVLLVVPILSQRQRGGFLRPFSPLQECMSDEECLVGQECFQEIDEEKNTGVCLWPDTHIESLVLHCKTNSDCPILHHCVATVTKSRGVCRPQAKPFNHAPKVFQKIQLTKEGRKGRAYVKPDTLKQNIGKKSFLLDAIVDNVKVDKQRLFPKFNGGDWWERQQASGKKPKVTSDDTFILSKDDIALETVDPREHDNDDHCGEGHFSETILEEEEEDFVFPSPSSTFVRRLRGVSSKDKCLEDHSQGHWQGKCSDPKFRDNYASKTQNRAAIKLIHAVFLNEKGEWPTKDRSSYNPVTLEDLEYQTKELEKYYNGTGINFDTSVVTVVDDEMYNSYLYKSGLPADMKKSLNEKILKRHII